LSSRCNQRGSQLGFSANLLNRGSRVFSQFGDDGIIQYIISRLDLPNAERRFVEFGVENYREANTHFLLLNDNWSVL
jgi:hypothetical protein